LGRDLQIEERRVGGKKRGGSGLQAEDFVEKEKREGMVTGEIEQGKNPRSYKRKLKKIGMRTSTSSKGRRKRLSKKGWEIPQKYFHA